MPRIDKHAPGSFCWIELGTTDQKAAKTFYSSLFGWNPMDTPLGNDEFYTIFQIEGRAAAAGYTIRKDDLAQGVPPHWMLYVAADNADDAAKRASKAGGKVVAPAFDVWDYGRMAVLQDPTGAHFSVWQPKTNTGIGIAGVDGTLCWADLSTPDPVRAKQFYSDVFGWTIVPGENDPSGYLHIKNGEQFIGGIPPAAYRDPNSPAHWLAYFLVSNCDASTAKAKQLGAKAYVEPMTMEGVGRWSVLADPQGAVFSAFQPLAHA
jgi:predicted enzyme related to lactoylglutathione lyase